MSNPTHKTAIVFTTQLDRSLGCAICHQLIPFLPRPLWIAIEWRGASAICTTCAARYAPLQLRCLRAHFGRQYGLRKDTPRSREINALPPGMLEDTREIVELQIEAESETPMTIVEMQIEPEAESILT